MECKSSSMKQRTIFNFNTNSCVMMKWKLLFCFVSFASARAISQQNTGVKLDAINAGVSWMETEFRYASFPFHFQSYLADGLSFPAITYNSYNSRDAVQQDYLWQLDADWRLQKQGIGKFWKHARFQTGAVYSAQTIPGQSLGTQDDVVIPGGVDRQLDVYSNDMKFSLLGLQLGWKQYWHPFRKKQQFGLYTGFSWTNLWTLQNDITQSNYYLHATSTAADGYKVISESTETGPDLQGKNFRWQRWQLPLGISYRIGKNMGISAEFNAGIYRHVLDKQRGKYDEAHGFSARIGYYF